MKKSGGEEYIERDIDRFSSHLNLFTHCALVSVWTKYYKSSKLVTHLYICSQTVRSYSQRWYTVWYIAFFGFRGNLAWAFAWTYPTLYGYGVNILKVRRQYLETYLGRSCKYAPYLKARPVRPAKAFFCTKFDYIHTYDLPQSLNIIYKCIKRLTWAISNYVLVNCDFSDAFLKTSYKLY